MLTAFLSPPPQRYILVTYSLQALRSLCLCAPHGLLDAHIKGVTILQHFLNSQELWIIYVHLTPLCAIDVLLCSLL